MFCSHTKNERTTSNTNTKTPCRVKWSHLKHHSVMVKPYKEFAKHRYKIAKQHHVINYITSSHNPSSNNIKTTLHHATTSLNNGGITSSYDKNHSKQ